jgi:hypothetical protein
MRFFDAQPGGLDASGAVTFVDQWMEMAGIPVVV